MLISCVVPKTPDRWLPTCEWRTEYGSKLQNCSEVCAQPGLQKNQSAKAGAVSHANGGWKVACDSVGLHVIALTMHVTKAACDCLSNACLYKAACGRSHKLVLFVDLQTEI